MPPRSYTCLGWGTQTDETFATGTNYGLDVDLAAPGVGIYSTWKGSSYAFDCGTSMSAPHVAGAAALVVAKYPGLTPSTVRLVLKGNTSPLADTAKQSENLLNVIGY